MTVERYDWARDEGLDFPDDPRAEPDLTELKEKAYACTVDESGGLRDLLSGVRDG